MKKAIRKDTLQYLSKLAKSRPNRKTKATEIPPHPVYEALRKQRVQKRTKYSRK